MSSYNLTDNQKKFITWIVQQIRNQNLPEEFFVVFTLNGVMISDYQGKLPPPDISAGALEALDKADLIIFKLLSRAQYKCIVLGKAYEAVDTNFGIQIDKDNTLPHHIINGQTEHIVILMIAGSGNQYRILEQAVRRVFECPPYYFEVRLTSDYTYKPERLENIREHIKRARGFVVEISELNPDIMLELGAAISDRNRPIFPLRSQDAAAEVITSFSSQIHITYSSLNQSVEQLASEISHAFERDGRIVHEDISNLISHRQKRYLSCTLLKNLQRTRLEPLEIRSLLKHYTTLEDLLAAEPTLVSRATGLPEYIILPLRGAITDSHIPIGYPQLPAKIEASKPPIEETATENLQLKSIVIQHLPSMPTIPLPEQKKMNPEIFLEQTGPLIKALIPVFMSIDEGNDRKSLLENADIDSVFIGKLKLGTQPNIFTPALVAEFKKYKSSNQKKDYHPQIKLLEHLVELADIYGLSEDDLRLFDRLIKQGQENFKALIARNAVGRIESPQGTGIGTGVLVAKNSLLTCNHVFTKTRVNTAWVRFGYSEDIFELDLNFIANCLHLDYALIRLQATPSLKHIAPVNATLDSRQKIRLIHHPLGKPVEISGLGEIVQVGEDYIDHNLNTDDGSSGAPIFNACWELIAIHRGNPGVGRPTTGTMEGKPISAIWNLIANHLS